MILTLAIVLYMYLKQPLREIRRLEVFLREGPRQDKRRKQRVHHKPEPLLYFPCLYGAAKYADTFALEDNRRKYARCAKLRKSALRDSCELSALLKKIN